jgi:Cu(I)/Ag(I) efflux system membrane protein CusA/SilA
VIARVAAWSGRHSRAVLLAAAVAAGAGYLAQRSLPRDVIPDLSDPQIVVVADWMGHPAGEVAAAVSAPLARALDGVAGATAVRAMSMSGMAYLDVVFGAGAALPRGRQEILARVEAQRPRLPPGVRVQVGPEASSTGWVFQYALLPPDKTHAMPMAEKAHEGDRALAPLRRFQDDVLRPALAALPGVAEVATVGGQRDELVVATTPDQLRGAGVAFSDVVAAVRAGASAGAGTKAGATADALGAAPLPVPSAAAATLGAVATVRVAPEMPSGVFDVDGRGSMVGGIVIARRDADPADVIARVKQVIDRERHRLPPGARLGVIYDRSELAGRVEGTLRRALAEEVAVVALVVLLFLLHARSALVPALTLPLIVVLTFAAMRLLGVAATVMSLGGIAIALGMAVDADLVALEACHRALEEAGEAPPGARRARIAAATAAFAPAILISLVIAALAFIPVFAFGGETGRLLRPLALTKTLVVAAAALVTLTVGPALRDRLLRGRIVRELGNPLTRALVRAYRPFVSFALARPRFTLATAALAVLSCVPLLPRLGSEFLPRVDEGSLLFMPTSAPGVTDRDAAADLVEQDAAIAERPEVAAVFGKVGRAETATDPAPFSMAETIVRLRPRAQWPKLARHRWYSGWAPAALRRPLGWLWPEETPPTTAELVELLDHAVRLPGWTSAWTAPVRARMDMMSTGVRTPVGVRVVAADPRRLDALGAAVRAAVSGLPGTKSAIYERLDAETRLAFAPDAAALHGHGVDPAAARAAADLLIAGGVVAETGGSGAARRVRITLDAPWLPRPLDDVLREATVRAGADGRGQPVPLGLLGRPVFTEVPALLRSERGELGAYVYVDVTDGADLSGYVARARAEVERAVGATLAPGERIEWTGQYQLIAAGQRRLALIVPIVALTMLLLLWLQFRNLVEALIVLASVPFALVGSFWTLHLLGYRLSAPVWVGLLSVVGLAMQTGVLMVVYIDDAFHRRQRQGRLRTRDDIVAAHAEGTVRRLRPKLMTIGTMAAALLPLLWSDGAGAEIMKRVAAPMLGGLVTSAFLTLEVIPVLYTLWRTRQLRAPAPAPAFDEPAIGPSGRPAIS